MTYEPDTLPHGREPTDNLWEAIYSQRAIRYCLDKPVPRTSIERVIEAGSKAPSGSSLQPWVFIVIDDVDKRDRIEADLRNMFEESQMLQTIVASGEKSPDSDVIMEKRMPVLQGIQELHVAWDVDEDME